MKKSFLHGVAIAAMTGMVLTACAQDTNIDQSLYPTILQQPVDQCLPIGGAATFSVVATNFDGFQWYKNNVAIDGETNSSLTIASLGINDVGYYGASVILAGEAVPTRLATLNVYTVTTPLLTTTTSLTSTLNKSKLSLQSTLSFSATDLGGGGVITVFGLPVVSGGGTSSGCPGKYSGYVNFSKPPSQGWGWAPTAGETHVVTDTNRPDTKVQFMGQWGDPGFA